MQGQWQGRFSGYSSGDITIEIDEHETYFSGRVCVFEDNNNLGVFVSDFATRDKNPIQDLNLGVRFQKSLEPFDIPSPEITAAFPNVNFPTNAAINLRAQRNGLKATATLKTATQTIGTISGILTQGSASKKSRITVDKKVKSWEKFKQMVGNLEPDRFIFRGQPVVNRLRTSFHRTNRSNLYRFLSSDIPQLHQMVTSKTKHYFDLRDNIQNAAFWNLLQHHGYPTPLLDWTLSPYVATYFAFREKPQIMAEPNRKIRIFMLDLKSWINDFPQLYSVVNVRPHFSLINPVALENPRAIPQQAICSITTVDDVENYLDLCGKDRGKHYLKVFELPFSERNPVLTELRLMGVAAGSLFPGIDGVCEEMKLRNFRN